MNKNMIEKIISSKNVDDNKVNIDMILINDSIDYKILNGINEINISSNKMEWVFSMDHFVPASTIEFTKKHNNIKMCIRDRILSEKTNESFEKVLEKFYKSRTYKALQNTQSTLWAESSEFIVDEVLREWNK